MSGHERIDVDRVLAGLKPFQRRSVDYVFDRLYGDSPTRRFLLADEVGLGKTLVARGVLAMAIRHLQDRGARQVNVVYVCSNADICRQNIQRLNPTRQEEFEIATRITRLPEVVHDLANKPLNFISFTPGTSFKYGHAGGQAAERRILYHLLRRTWPKSTRGAGLKNLLQGSKARERFRDMLRSYDPDEALDQELARAFCRRLRDDEARARESQEQGRRQRLRRLCAGFRRSKSRHPRELWQDRNAFVGELRALLAAVCIDSLKPDLVVLDEFQRFKDLLAPDNAAGLLAQHLFTRTGTKVLLLSATPYKMYTLSEELENDDHYKDFASTLRFLTEGDSSGMEALEADLNEYGRQCMHAADGPVAQLSALRTSLEARLRSVMCRTEKLAVTADRGGMLREVSAEPLVPHVMQIRAYLETRRIAEAVGQSDVVEYWKSSPYLLNFMDADHYKLKEAFKAALDGKDAQRVVEAARTAKHAVMDQAAWREYRQLDLCNAQLDRLADETVRSGWWRLLWMPPCLPYYKLGGPFSDPGCGRMTKRLVFSGWHVVPRAIAVLLSYEAERLMIGSLDPDARNTEAGRKTFRPRLMFDRADGLPAGMPTLALVYPSHSLANLGQMFGRERWSEELPTLELVLERLEQRIAVEIAPLIGRARDSGAEDQRWYWATPILLDRRHSEAATRDWFGDVPALASAWSGLADDSRGWVDHVTEAAAVASGAIPLGRPPRDLVSVLALLTVAGPGVCALRGLSHALGGAALHLDPNVRHAAGRIAWGMRALFNTPDVTALVRGMNADEPYWRRVLEYCAAGCLQSVFDEYLHLLVELEGLGDESTVKAAQKLATRVMHAAGLRTATPGFDRFDGRDGLSVTNQRARARFAMRFGDERGEREESGLRKDEVRGAFNSPFWPFILATTSVGQEGLDFHPYCHAVMHWNLPNNPVDMEQREGRVHRFKGHAVRKNVVRSAVDSGCRVQRFVNPWHALFEQASSVATDDSGISPFWVFPGEASIERHTGVLALSREASKLPALRSSLAVYRMVFGQPRQEDLLAHLRRTIPDDQLQVVAAAMSISLEPPANAKTP